MLYSRVLDMRLYGAVGARALILDKLLLTNSYGNKFVAERRAIETPPERGVVSKVNPVHIKEIIC